MTANVFISFASQDRKVALTLCSALENRGFQCWISARDIQPGENFQTAIVKAIRQAKIMLLVFTANSNTSEEMTKELALASQFKVMVVPLRIEDVAPSDAFAYEFATRQWIDFFSDWELAIQQLSRRIEYAVTQPAAQAKLPQAADADVLEMAPPVAKEKVEAAPAAPLKGAPAPTAKGGKDAAPAAPLSKIFPDSTASDSTPPAAAKKAATPPASPKAAPPKVSTPVNASADAPKSSKTPLIVGAVVGVILIAAAIAGAVAMGGKGKSVAPTEDVPAVDATPVTPIEGPVTPIGPAPPPVAGAPAVTAPGVPPGVAGTPVKGKAAVRPAPGVAPNGAVPATGEVVVEQPKAPPPRPRPAPEPKQPQEPTVLY